MFTKETVHPEIFRLNKFHDNNEKDISYIKTVYAVNKVTYYEK